MNIKNIPNALSNSTALLVKVGLTFALVFNISFTTAPSISTGRVALLLMIILYGRGSFTPFMNFIKTYIQPFSFYLFLISYSLFLISLNNFEDYILFSRLLWFFNFSIIAAFFYMRMCNYSLSRALTFYLLAILVQSFFVFYSVMQPDFRFWINDNLINGGNIDFSTKVRFSGLSNGGGANLSIQLSMATIAVLYLFSKAETIWEKIFLILSTIIITIATIFVGRTGLYICLLSLISFLVISKQGLSILLPLSLITAIAVFLFPKLDLINKIDSLYDIKLEHTLAWAFDFLFTGQSSTATALIANLSDTHSLNPLEFIFGSGRIITADGLNYSRHDSGYIHSLYAMGFPLSLLFYLSLCGIYLYNLKPVTGTPKYIGLGLVCLVFLVECKEPYIFKYTLPFFTMVYTYLAKLDSFNSEGCKRGIQ